MSKPRLIRGFVAIATIATLLSTTCQSSAAELNRLVVTGIALDRVAIQHPFPAYPQNARSLRIAGEVQVRVHVENGNMLSVTAESASPTLASYSSRWVRWHWRFRPSVTGVYLLPISYRLSV